MRVEGCGGAPSCGKGTARLNKGRLPSREEMLNNLLSLMACHAAVRAGDRLSQELIAELLAQLQLAQDSHHIPSSHVWRRQLATLSCPCLTVLALRKAFGVTPDAVAKEPRSLSVRPITA